MTKYDPTSFETKWQKFWEENQLFQSSQNQDNVTPDNKEYILFAFAYPSGEGLHVGHVESKTALDIVARFHRMNGKKVFFPVGWDAFGLPAENYAIKTGVHPAETTKKAIDNFRRQVKRVGISYDWDNEIATSHPGYYKWTQWIFLKLFEKGLAYKNTGQVNWCPSCQTVLANEQVVEGVCERCGTEVVQKELDQWYFKITEYQDELISGLDQVDWPNATKQQQLNWIGKKQGITISYPVVTADGTETDVVIECFTTRPDTNFGATFVVIAPEHKFAKDIAKGEIGESEEYRFQMKQYIEAAQSKTELERQQEGTNKTGAFTGYYAVNQLTNKKMPIWVSDFVLGGFGTGAVVGVPGHDLRDFEFAEFVNKSGKQKIEVIRVVVGNDGDKSEITRSQQVQEEDGVMINSEFLDGMDIHEATTAMMDHLVQQGWGKITTTYKLRDWLISRQRYWGAPIPIVYDPEGKPHPVKEEHLPWQLPTDVEFKPTGESPLKHSKEFIERTEKLYGKGWRPEFDTMDTFVDSSWYFLRYVSARNEEVFASKEQLDKWLPVDLYMIGPEHIVLHLLYSRFFTKFLRDEGYLNFDEPFKKMRHQGMILGPDNKKMSKSKGNVINPDEIIEKFGADALRVYEMFMGPLDADKAWETRALIGVHKFLAKMQRLVEEGMSGSGESSGFSSDKEVNPVVRKLHQTIAKVTEDIPQLKFNTAIAALMEFSNTWSAESTESNKPLSRDEVKVVIKLLAPFAPFLAEELYQQFWPGESVHVSSWPESDAELATEDEVVIAIQVNGKLRGEVIVASSQVNDQQLVVDQAMKLERVQVWLDGKEVAKEIYVPGRILNIVIR